MASSLKLYTTGNMDKATLHNDPNEDSGYPAENCLDNNLDTYWKASAGIYKNIAFDFQEAKQVDCLLIFTKNYKTTGNIASAYWSDNGTSWTLINQFSMVDYVTPIRIFTNGFGSSHRYWRIIFTQGQEYRIAGIWWGSYYNIAQGNEYPEADADRFYNRVSALPGGRIAVAGINRRSSRLISRQYVFSGVTEFNKLRNAFLDSSGRRFPLVMNEGSAQGDARLVRFANDDFAENEIDYQMFRPSISFIELPYIDDGELY